MTAEPLAVLTGVLRLQRRALGLWAVALAAVTALYASFYPTMGTTAEMQGLVDSLPEGMITAFGWEDITSPAGYLSSTVYGLIAPALLLVHAVALGARLLAGQEEDGTLELEASAPVGRRRLLAERLAALWL
ncbi:MAG: ABC transporter permease subunit, partial [Actinomycetota bacterium]